MEGAASKYEEDKKKDPDFAIPPSEDQLPKPAPKKVWQQGKDEVARRRPGDRRRRQGARRRRRSSTRRRSASGPCSAWTPRPATRVWQARLPLNPWGGASVVGDTVVVTGSTIGYDHNELKGAKGDVAAFDLDDRQAEVAEGRPTGGVRRLRGAGGRPGGLHRDRRQGAGVQPRRRRAGLDLRREDAALRPARRRGRRGLRRRPAGHGPRHRPEDRRRRSGRFAGGKDPAVMARRAWSTAASRSSGGKLFVATCNLEGPFARKPTAVVCLGAK